MIFSLVLYVTVDDRLYGGPFPAALLSDPGATGASGVGAHLARAPRLLGLWIDRDVGLLRWAPFAALAFVAIWLLLRSRRERLAIALSDQVDVEVTAAFYVAICGATVAFATFLAPTIAGAGVPRPRAHVRPAAGRRARRVGAAALAAHRPRARRAHARRERLGGGGRALRRGRGGLAAPRPATLGGHRARPAASALNAARKKGGRRPLG